METQIKSTKKSANEKALACRERMVSLSAGIKAGAIPKLQGAWARKAIAREEMENPFIIRKTFDSAMRFIAQHTAGEDWEVGMNIENGMYYFWRKRAVHWEPGEDEGVTFTDEDDMGLESAFVNVVTARAG